VLATSGLFCDEWLNQGEGIADRLDVSLEPLFFHAKLASLVECLEVALQNIAQDFCMSRDLGERSFFHDFAFAFLQFKFLELQALAAAADACGLPVFRYCYILLPAIVKLIITWRGL
jgi:hypothetical protein